jgi:hypothetical protein
LQNPAIKGSTPEAFVRLGRLVFQKRSDDFHRALAARENFAARQ